MGVLLDANVTVVNHYTPIHYLPFIARSAALLSKPSLKKAGFAQSHLRSMSRDHDEGRGFGRFAFLTLDASPRILIAKLAKGFPHIAIGAPESAVEDTGFGLCRFNIAMTRQLRRNGKWGFPESETNGRYYGVQQVPIARTDTDKRALLKKHLPLGTMIEVLIEGDLPLPNDTVVTAYDAADAKECRRILATVASPWTVQLAQAPGPYRRNQAHVASAQAFISRAIADPMWRGDGLEFDKL